MIENGTFHAYYRMYGSGKLEIHHASSANGTTFTKDSVNNPMLEVGAGGSWDDVCVGVSSFVWKEGSTYYMIYRGDTDAYAINRIGLATASNPEGPWTKSASNPILTGTEAWEIKDGKSKIDPCNIIKVNDTYYLYYSSIISPIWSSGLGRSIGVATASSPAGPWTKSVNNPILHGNRVCSSTFFVDPYYYIASTKFAYIEGGDIASRGYLELWRSLSPLFTNIEFVKVIHKSSQSWDAGNNDVVSIVCDDIYRNTFPDNMIRCYFSGNNGSIWSIGLITADNIADAIAIA